ncbi:MAG: protoporphyrinogen oxidase, partial [Chloroflexota bacterium]
MIPHVVIVGGGIAGLATAYSMRQAVDDHGLQVKVTLVEREARSGGKIVTDTSSGFVIEGGPDSFITQKPWALQLCRELGLEERLVGTNDARRAVYVLRGGKLRKMPDGMLLIVPTRFMPFVTSDLISWPGKIRMGLDLFIKPRQDNSDESLADFIRRRLGREALEVLAEPMMAGIHVSDAETLSLRATFPRFVDIERKYGSLTRGMIAARQASAAHANGRDTGKTTMFMTLQGGLQELVSALERSINGEVRCNTSVTWLEPLPGGGYRVTLDDGATLDTDAVILATPAFVSADLLRDLAPELAGKLDAIRYVSTATVSLGYDADEFEHPLDGFGFVVSRHEPTRLLACTWTSTKFPQRAAPG